MTTETNPDPFASQAWALTADQAKSYRTDILLALFETEDGEMTDSSLVKWGSQHALGWHPEVQESLIGEKLIVNEAPVYRLSSTGWKLVVGIRDARHEEILLSKEEELEIHREHARGEKELVGRRQVALAEIDTAKGMLDLKKTALKGVEEEIAAYLAIGPQTKAMRGKQQSLLDIPGVMKSGQDGIAAGWTGMLPGVKDDRVIVYGARDDAADLPTQEQVLAALVKPLVFEGDKRVISKDQVVSVAGHPFIVTALWHDPLLHESRANLTRLHTEKEWASKWAETLGQAVEGSDQTDEAREKRQTEGANCGLVIMVGNKRRVIGPQSQALHIVHVASIAEAADNANYAEPGFDSKAAAAGDGKEPEEVIPAEGSQEQPEATEAKA